MHSTTEASTAADRPSSTSHGRATRWGRLTARQVNLLLEALVFVALLTGAGSWMVSDRWVGWVATTHAVAGLALAIVVPAKLRGSVRTGFRRRRTTRWLSTVFGVLVLAALIVGVLHTTGLWFGVGPWSALWTHQLLSFVIVPFFVWHLVSRPVRPKVTDIDRRAAIRTGVIAGGAAGVYVAQRVLSGDDRRQTGSREIASFDPANMPRVSWINDTRPDNTAADAWELRVDGEPMSIAALWERARPVAAVLDCTGGWWSEQHWDAVALDVLIARPSGRSVRVLSSTGYDRYIGTNALDRTYLAVGYGGQPLRAGHGAPVRLIVPGRRGPWWVKWVTSVSDSDRPTWMQPPLPLA
ncbi:MAG: molybdopterin-dependent oxidoreductase [Actinomycetota bacterium]